MINTHFIGDLTTRKLNHHFNNMICGFGNAYGAEIKSLQCYFFSSLEEVTSITETYT